MKQNIDTKNSLLTGELQIILCRLFFFVPYALYKTKHYTGVVVVHAMCLSTFSDGRGNKSSMPDLSFSKKKTKKPKKYPINSITFINMSVILNNMLRMEFM